MTHFKQNKLQVMHLLNIVRINLSKLFRQQQELSEKEVLQNLLIVQIIAMQNQYICELKILLEENTENILAIMNNKIQNKTQQTKKYDIKWNNKYHGKKNIRETINNALNKQQQIETMNKKSQQFKQPELKIPQNNNTHSNKLCQFVAASNLPKGTSVRKRFVPPFKKTQIHKEQTQKKNQEEEEKMQVYKNLDEILVSIIESEIVQRDHQVKWSQIAGLGFAKKIVHEMIVWPMLRPDIFTGLRSPPRGILLFGPPGTGKTMIGRAIASQAAATFFSISASSLTSKWVGQSQKLVKTLFTVARAKQPSVIFIDEIDSLLCSRSQGEQESTRRVKTEFLVQLDGMRTNSTERVLIIGATNLPQELDDAVRRRFVKRLYIPLPNYEGRLQLITSLTSSLQFSLTKKDQQKLSEMVKGFSGADLYSLCSEAALIPLRQLNTIQNVRQTEIPSVTIEHFKEAIKLVRPSVNTKLLKTFQIWNEQYGSYQLSKDERETVEDLQK